MSAVRRDDVVRRGSVGLAPVGRGQVRRGEVRQGNQSRLGAN